MREHVRQDTQAQYDLGKALSRLGPDHLHCLFCLSCRTQHIHHAFYLLCVQLHTLLFQDRQLECAGFFRNEPGVRISYRPVEVDLAHAT